MTEVFPDNRARIAERGFTRPAIRVRFKGRMRNDEPTGAPTLFLLLAQYSARTVIPLDTVRKDFFSHLTEAKLLQKCLSGRIRLPILRIEHSQKAQRGVHVADLAKYIDERRAEAIKEAEQLCGDDG